MRTRELLLECKVALGVSSDYALAAALKIPRARISDYMKGDRIPDEYACFRIGEALGREPSEIIAEIRAETDEKHAEFWRDFLQRRGLLGLVVGASLLSYSISYAPESAAAECLNAHNVYYVKSQITRNCCVLAVAYPSLLFDFYEVTLAPLLRLNKNNNGYRPAHDYV